MERCDFLKSMGLGAAVLALPGCAGRLSGVRAKPGKRPNILFFFPDQLRHDWIEPNPALASLPRVAWSPGMWTNSRLPVYSSTFNRSRPASQSAQRPGQEVTLPPLTPRPKPWPPSS